MTQIFAIFIFLFSAVFHLKDVCNALYSRLCIYLVYVFNFVYVSDVTFQVTDEHNIDVVHRVWERSSQKQQ